MPSKLTLRPLTLFSASTKQISAKARLPQRASPRPSRQGHARSSAGGLPSDKYTNRPKPTYSQPTVDAAVPSTGTTCNVPRSAPLTPKSILPCSVAIHFNPYTMSSSCGALSSNSIAIRPFVRRCFILVKSIIGSLSPNFRILLACREPRPSRSPGGASHAALPLSSAAPFDVILVGDIVGLGPSDDEFLHRIIPISEPPIQQAQSAGRVLEVAKRPFAFYRPP